MDLKGNKIVSFKVEGNCPQCWTLYLEDNQLKELDAEFLDPFPNLGRLRLEGNPLHESIKSNITEDSFKTLEFVKGYLSDLSKGKSADRESKVLLIGNGNVGKSCLVQRLVNNRFVEEWNSTHAISLEQYPKNWNKATKDENRVDPFLLNVWDFGGQDIYHATHRLFMQENAVYLLLWDHETEESPATFRVEQGEERKYENHKLHYWLSYSRSQGKSSPVIVVQTKTGRDGKKDISSVLRDFYDKIDILKFHHIESKEEDWKKNGYEDLTRRDQACIRKNKGAS